MIATILKYLDTDLLCYRASGPEALCQRQSEIWQPFLDQFEKQFGAPLKTTTELQTLSQDDAHVPVRAWLESLSSERLNILHDITRHTGSVILAIALLEGKSSPEYIVNAVFLEETYKEGLYDVTLHGPDPMIERAKEGLLTRLKAALKN